MYNREDIQEIIKESLSFQIHIDKADVYYDAGKYTGDIKVILEVFMKNGKELPLEPFYTTFDTLFGVKFETN